MSWRGAGRGRAPPRQARDEQVQADAALAAMIAEEERRLVRQQRQEQGYTGRASSGSGRKRGLPLAPSKSAAAAPAAAAGAASVPKRPKRIKRRKKVTEGSARSLGSSSTSAASSSSSSASSSSAAAVASWTPSADAAASESARRAAELRLLEKLNKLDMNVSVVPGDGSKLLDAFRGQVAGADQSIAHLTHFRDGRAYVRFWEYLVLENLRAQLRSEYEASLGDEEGVVSGMVGELSQAGKAPWASVKASNEDAFRLTLRKRAGTRLGMPCAANDVILIVPEQCKANEGAGASFPVEYLLALAERGVSASATQLRVRLTFAEAARQAKSARRPELGHTHHVARCFVRLLNASPVLRARLSGKSVQEMPSVAKRTTFRLVNLRSAVPVLREYVALRTLEESSPLAQMLIQPPWTGAQQQADESSHEKGWKHVPPGFREHLRASLNARQLDAVGSTLDCLADAASASRIALLQGPPGTGKTRTVVALLNALHLNMYQKFYRKLVDGAAEIIKRMRGEAGSGKAEAAAAAAAAAVHAPGGLASILAHQEAQRSRTAASASVATQQRQLLARAAQEKPRILVCAPSNGAVDEIISRVRFVDGELVEYEPTMLRIGRESRVQEGAQQAVLSVQVAEWMRLGSARSRAALAERAEIAQAKIDEAHVRLNQFVGTGLRSVEERMALASLAEELANANLELSRCQMVQALGQASTSRVQDRVRAQLEKSLLDNAHIVFATLSGTGGALMRDNPRPFDLVIVDEAAQSAETTTLIGLCRRTTRCVLVGDPAQLPATVHIRDGTLACRLAERSLFERLQEAGCPVVDLRVQYRMHPAIRAFPSRRFYGDRLQDGDNVLSREYARAFHAHAPFLPYAFFQVNGRERLAHGRSAANDAEVHAVLDHLAAFLHAFPDVDPARIGIITGYRGQQARFRSLVRRHPMRARLQAVEVNTVDAFQGREKDIVVISCVRSSHGASRTSTIGFLASVKRMNVMLTRAKYALWVFGDARALSTNRDWRALLDDARHRRVYLEPRGV